MVNVVYSELFRYKGASVIRLKNIFFWKRLLVVLSALILTGFGAVLQCNHKLGPFPQAFQEGYHQGMNVLCIVRGKSKLLSFNSGQSEALILQLASPERSNPSDNYGNKHSSTSDLMSSYRVQQCSWMCSTAVINLSYKHFSVGWGSV